MQIVFSCFENWWETHLITVKRFYTFWTDFHNLSHMEKTLVEDVNIRRNSLGYFHVLTDSQLLAFLRKYVGEKVKCRSHPLLKV